MFNIDLTDSYTFPIVVEIASDGGRYDKLTFDATFKRFEADEVAEIMRQIRDGETTDKEVGSKILVGWKGIVDKSGQAVPFSEGAREVVFNKIGVLPAVIRTWAESLRGVKAKN